MDTEERFVQYILRLVDIIGDRLNQLVDRLGGYEFFASLISMHAPLAMNTILHGDDDPHRKRMVATVSGQAGQSDVVRDLMAHSFLEGYLAAHPDTKDEWLAILKEIDVEAHKLYEDAARDQDEDESEDDTEDFEEFEETRDENEDMETQTFDLQQLLDMFMSGRNTDDEDDDEE